MYRGVGEPVTDSARQSSVPRWVQQPAFGSSTDPTAAQISRVPPATRVTAHSVAEPGSRAADACHCNPSGEVHTAGPRLAPVSVAPIATYPSGPPALRDTI